MQSVFDAIDAFVQDVRQGAGGFAERSAEVLREMADWFEGQGQRLMTAVPAPTQAASDVAACRQRLDDCARECTQKTAAGPAANWAGPKILNFIEALKKLLDLFG